MQATTTGPTAPSFDVYFHQGTNMKVDVCHLSACRTTIISDDILI